MMEKLALAYSGALHRSIMIRRTKKYGYDDITITKATAQRRRAK
jgi:argininosuccinate synthase